MCLTSLLSLSTMQNAVKSIEGRQDGVFAVCERYGDDCALDLLYMYRGQSSTFRIASAPVRFSSVLLFGFDHVCVCVCVLRERGGGG